MTIPTGRKTVGSSRHKPYVSPNERRAPLSLGMLPGRGVTADISQSAWNKFLDRTEKWRVPSILERPSMAFEPEEYRALPQSTAAPKEMPWISLPASKRPWSQWLDIVGKPEQFSCVVEVLWQEVYKSPVPNDLILIVRKYGQNGGFVTNGLSVYPKTDSAMAELRQRYTHHAILTLKRLPNSHFVVMQPVVGPGAADVVVASLKGRDVEIVHAVERSLMSRVAGSRIATTGGMLGVSWKTFLEYVRAQSDMLVATMSNIESTVNLDSELLPDRISLTVLNNKGRTNSVKPMTWEDAEQLSVNYSQLFFERISALRYALVRIKGNYAMDVAEAFLKGLGVFPDVPLSIEKLMVAGMLRDGAVKDAPAQPWAEYLGYIGSHGHDLWGRMLALYQATHHHDPDELPTTLWVMASRTFIDSVVHLKRLVVSDHDSDGAMATLQIAPTELGTRVISIKGSGVLDVAVAWLNSVGLDVQGTIEKTLVGGTWGVEVHWPHTDEAPTWQDWREYVQHYGVQSFGKRMRQIYDYVHMGEPSPDDFVVLGRNRKTDGVDLVNGLKVVSLAECPKLENSAAVMRLQFHRNPDGEDVLVDATGKGAKEIAALLKPKGGLVLAPDATQSDKQTQEIASYSSKNFGNIEDQLCKPEPLFTPADLMPVPQLERPSDIVELPKEGGFEATDPEVVKNFQTPPTVTRPVITHCPMPHDTTDTTLLVVAAGLLVMADGPFPFGDAAAVSLLGARFAFGH